jgi:uncharacterized protein
MIDLAKGKPMRREMMEILVCPVCKAELELSVDREDDDEVLDGSLRCAACDERYPIADGIPNLLPADMREATA